LKPHPLRRALSFFWEIPIEKISSDISGPLEISLHKGEWKLSTENARRQTRLCDRKNFSFHENPRSDEVHWFLV
jgi:hypothetical protein